jgi:hypothetical protein
MIILFYTIAFLFLMGWALAILGLQAGAWAHLLLLGTVLAVVARFTCAMICSIKPDNELHKNKPGREIYEQRKA